MGSETNPLGLPAWAWRLTLLVAALLAAYGLSLGLSQWARALLMLDDWGFTDPGPRIVSALFGTTCLVTMGIALLVLARGRKDARAVLLGLALLGAAPLSAFGNLPWSLPGNASYYIDWTLRPLVPGVLALFWPLFCLHAAGGASRARARRAVFALAAGLAALSVPISFTPLFLSFASPFSVFADLVLFLAIQGAGFGILLWLYPSNDAAGRNRIKVLLVAFAAYLLSWLLARQMVALVNRQQLDLVVPFSFGATTSGLLGAGLIAYAVLRQKLFDFGFALNRTLVYAAVSFVLLAAFGGAKWVIEHLIPESWHAGSDYYSFAIALGLFLVLHRIHTWVERNVERVFFGPWHRNEAALKRFVAAAGHFEQAGELCRAFAEELRRYAGGAGAAIYRRERNGLYALEQGSLDGAAAHYSADDLALATMRAERGPVSLGEVQTALSGTLALPMIHHGTLSGFALLGRKPDGSNYRPDEVEVLGWAAQQVGLDLQTMHVSELEAEVARLGARLAARGPIPARKRA